ncbi:MAG: nucleotide exchange factor GrpE [Acidobacteriia bacterium]|nr:nucleotide exchange factor GrpE [Terriglobia bacterium]
MAEPKREEEKVIPFDSEHGGEAANESLSRPGDDSPSQASETGGDSAVAAEIAKLRGEKDDLQQLLIRRQADFENYRKRIERDRHEEGRRGVERLITELIPVLDAFDRALHAHEDPANEEYRQGVTLIRKQLWDALARHGVTRIDAAGKMFDPHVHQAIERVESIECPDGSIVDVFQDGYLFHGRVLRPAIVRVAVHPNDAVNSETRKN